MTVDRALRLAAVAIVIGLGAVGLALPDSILLGGCAWLVAVTCALSGWGWLVVRVAGVDDVDFGLRAAWGIAAYLALAGVLVMFGVCSRPVILAAIAVGSAAFAWREWQTPAPLWQTVRTGARALRERPLAAYCAILLGAAFLLVVLGAVVNFDRNPYDDDIAYTPFVKRLLQVGNLVEPFSFRRLASYGGQTALQALTAARGNISSVHAFDHGVCFAIAALLLVGHARQRRAPAFAVAVVALVLLMSPEISINTASYWSGAVIFYALYRTLAMNGTRRELAIAVLLVAAACTLRMNYVAAAVPFLAFVFAARARTRGWRGELKEWRLAAVVGIVGIAPWCIASYISNQTFLFPYMQGTWNHGLDLQPSTSTWLDKLGVLASTCIQSEPVIVLPMLFPLFAVTSDQRPGRPFTAFFLASLLGFVLLVLSFTSADTYSIWRYAFAYAFPLVLVLAIEVAEPEGDVRLPALGRWLLLAGLLVQLAFARTGFVKRYADVFKNLGTAGHVASEARVEAPRYEAMQDAVPPGERLAVMLDDAVYIDFARNDIINLDTPGWASASPQMPSFLGAEAMRAYFLDVGVRYIAFVRSDRSRYFFRREFWVWRLFHDEEVFQTMSAYLLDTIDNLEQLSTSTKVLYDHSGLVVLDLEGPHEPAHARDPAGEPSRRFAFIREVARREHLLGEWSLTSREDLVFVDGTTNVTYPDTETDPHWYDVVYRDPEPTRGTPIRWMHRRAHLRVRGQHDMHLVLRGRVNLNSIYTRPRLEISLDGEVMTTTTVDADGSFVADVTVPAERLAGWTDLYATFDSIGQPEKDVYDLKIARLEEVIWEPR